jgi:hypothetical protein
MSGKRCLAALNLAFVAFVLGHCFLAVARAKAPVPKPPPRPTISLGQPLEEALEALKTAKARDIRHHFDLHRRSC